MGFVAHHKNAHTG